ncbi:MAG: hypothetical protein K0Q79_863 [Flavipsychrobacter sp.]|jgi:hypothetical protein|nr:hypothetical protein [Flavipsychrobacter sp.]
MNKDNGILQELVEMGSPLAMLPRTMPYHVPDGYFTQLSNTIQGSEIEWNEPDIIPGWSKKMPYKVPDGYFEHLTGSIVSSAIAHGASKAPYSVPDGYFEQLPAQILKAAMAAHPEVKTPPNKRLNLFRSVQWAAAAIFILFMGVGAYITFSNTGQPGSENMLAAVSNKELHDYVQINYRVDIDKVEGATNLNDLQLDDEDIIEYLNETGWDFVEL